jgi:hypothetical protein
MWQGFNRDVQRDFQTIKALTNLTRQTPTKEWPLIFVKEHDLLLVVREWPNGEITAYATSEFSDRIRRRDPS